MTGAGGHRIFGSASDDEQKRVLAAIEKMLGEEKERARPSAWKLYGRAAGLRIGASELRNRLPGRWSTPSALGWSGSGPQDIRGRGDAK